MTHRQGKAMEKQRCVCICGLLCLAAATSAQAGDVNHVGASVRNALELQRSGRAAAPVRPMLEGTAERSYARYLESFTYPIPEQFDRSGAFAADSGN